jgi:hypothetical protein
MPQGKLNSSLTALAALSPSARRFSALDEEVE